MKTVLLVVLALLVLAVEGQDLGPSSSAGYIEWWDSPERARWRAAKGLPVSPVPRKPVVEAAAVADVPVKPGMVAGSWGAVVLVAKSLARGTCRYVEWNGRTMLVKGNMDLPEGTTPWTPDMHHQAEARHCRLGVL